MAIYGNPYDVIVPLLNSWLFKNPFDAYVCVRDCIYVILCISIERWRERIMKMQNDANTNIVCGTMILYASVIDIFICKCVKHLCYENTFVKYHQ